METIGICTRSYVFLFSLVNYVKAFLPLQSICVVFGSIVLLSHGFRGPLCWQYWVIHGGNSSVSVLMNLRSTVFLALHYFQPKLGMYIRYRMLSRQNFLYQLSFTSTHSRTMDMMPSFSSTISFWCSAACQINAALLWWKGGSAPVHAECSVALRIVSKVATFHIMQYLTDLHLPVDVWSKLQLT